VYIVLSGKGERNVQDSSNGLAEIDKTELRELRTRSKSQRSLIEKLLLERPGKISDNMADEIKHVFGYLPCDRESTTIVNGNIIRTDSCSSESMKKSTKQSFEVLDSDC
jgi:hypothetical protein